MTPPVVLGVETSTPSRGVPPAVDDAAGVAVAGMPAHVTDSLPYGNSPDALVHQVPARRALEEGIDDLDVGDAGKLGALLGEAPHVVAKGLIGLLATPFEVQGVPRAHVRALEVAHEDLD